MIGFARNAVLGAAGKVVELVKAGKIRHFFLVGGCDGAKSGKIIILILPKKRTQRHCHNLHLRAANTVSTNLSSGILKVSQGCLTADSAMMPIPL